jgi:hypothetical protein
MKTKMCRSAVHVWLLFPLCALLLVGCASGGTKAAKATCGAWTATVPAEDPRLVAALQASPADSGCEGDFQVTSATKALGILGGYTLEMTADHATNVKSQTWTGVSGSHPNQVLPAHVSEFHIAPQNMAGKAEMAMTGAITRDSLTTDTSLFLIKSALALIALPAGCAIPPDLILNVANDQSGTIQKAGDFLLNRDVAGTIDELRRANDPFFTQAIGALKAQAPQCAVGLLANVLGAVTGVRGFAFVAKTSVNFGGWAGAVVEDEVKYQGRPVRISFIYAPPAASR